MTGMIDEPKNPPSAEELQAFLIKNELHEAIFNSVTEDIEDRQTPPFIRKRNGISMAQWKAIIVFCKDHGYPRADTYNMDWSS